MPELGIDRARRIFDAAAATAVELGVPMTVAIVDPAGHPILLARTDGAMWASISIAQAIAETVVAFRMEGVTMKPFEQSVWFSSVPLRCGSRTIAGESGLRIIVGGELLGGIGVSGGSGAQDRACALAGLQAIGVEPA